MDLINTRRKIKRKLIRNDYNDIEMLGEFYLVNKTIREEIKAIKIINGQRLLNKFEKSIIIESRLEQNSSN